MKKLSDNYIQKSVQQAPHDLLLNFSSMMQIDLSKLAVTIAPFGS